MTEDHYPEWAQTICSWKYLWVVELALLLAIIILIITACRFYFQMKEAERFLKEDEEAGSDAAKQARKNKTERTDLCCNVGIRHPHRQPLHLPLRARKGCILRPLA
jgi:uncharacterized protein YpmS